MGNDQPKFKCGYMYPTRPNGDICIITGIGIYGRAYFGFMLSGPEKGKNVLLYEWKLVDKSDKYCRPPTLEEINKYELYKHIPNIYEMHGYKPTYVAKTIYVKQEE